MNLFSIRVEFFFFWLKELNFFLNMTQLIEPIFLCDSKIEIFGWKSQKWNFSIFWKLKIDFFHMTRRIEPAFFNKTQRIELFLKLTQSFLNGLEESNPFFFNTTQRIEPF